MLEVKITEIFVSVDDFCLHFEQEFKQYQLVHPGNAKKRNRKKSLADSEIISILIAFHGGQFRNFKHFYVN